MDITQIYRFLINDTLLPQTPGSFNTSNDNQNEKIKLASGKPFTIAELDGAEKYDFEFEITNQVYPYTFSDALEGFNFYTDLVRKIKAERNAVTLTIIRSRGLPSTCVDVLLEDYSFTEDAENGNDFTFKVSFVRDCPQNNQELDTQIQHHLITAGAARGWVDTEDKREISDAAKQAAQQEEERQRKEEKLAQKEADAQARKDGG